MQLLPLPPLMQTACTRADSPDGMTGREPRANRPGCRPGPTGAASAVTLPSSLRRGRAPVSCQRREGFTSARRPPAPPAPLPYTSALPFLSACLVNCGAGARDCAGRLACGNQVHVSLVGLRKLSGEKKGPVL